MKAHQAFVVLSAVVCFVAAQTLQQSGRISDRQDAVSEKIIASGFQAELHRVVTEDNYILRMHRILPKVQNYKKGPVLLLHGMFSSSYDFIATGPATALGKS